MPFSATTTLIINCKSYEWVVQGVPTSSGWGFSKKFEKISKDKKKSWKFVYILAKQCRCPFNLTKKLTKYFKVLISRILGFMRFMYGYTLHTKLVGTPWMYVMSTGLLLRSQLCRIKIFWGPRHKVWNHTSSCPVSDCFTSSAIWLGLFVARAPSSFKDVY